MKAVTVIPRKVKVLNLKAVGDLVYEDIDTKPLTKGTVLVKVEACGICSSDIERVFLNGTYHFPTVIGHEFAGKIVAVYDDEQADLLGKKAVIFPLLPCDECEACQDENYALCSNYNYFGSRCDGGFSQYLVVPIWNLVLFDNISYEEAAMCEPAAVALHASRRVDIKQDDTVLLVGTGTIAFLIGMFCQKAGAKVLMAGRREESLKLAEKFGFIPILNDDNVKEHLKQAIDQDCVDTVFEVVGSNAAINTALSLAVNRVVFVGNPKEDVLLDKNNYWRILRKELAITGTWNSNFGSKKNDWCDVLEILSSKEIDLTPLITKIYDMKDYKEAFDLVRSSALTYKVILKPNGDD